MCPATLSPPAGPLLIGEAPPSASGPVESGRATTPLPPSLPLSPMRQTLRFLNRPLPFLFESQRRLGDTFSFHIARRGHTVVLTNHPDHAKALFTASPDLVPSMTAESPLRPVLGANSVLTANPPRHMPQRKLLLPPFHGEAIARYTEVIEQLVRREVDSWEVGATFSMAKRMQAVTLDVIMAGIFGVEGEPEAGSPERGLRDITRRMLSLSEAPAFKVVEFANAGRMEPSGLLKLMMGVVDRHYYRAIRTRRDSQAREAGRDVLSLLLATTDEDGQPLSDQHIRDELLTLVLAGHETTANSLAWAFERLLRTPAAYDALRDSVRGGAEDADAYVEATINEAMRVRPVIPMIGRRVAVDWQLGDHVVPAGTAVSVCIALLHHRDDLYPQPFAFRPERFLGVKPGTYTWIPFGGGTRRCLGATLAMAEQRIVVRTIAERVDLVAPDPRPERESHRNVTIIPREGGAVTVRRCLA